jgi:hypothetical protein
MCGAGRRIICPDIATWTTWHTPCTELGATAWEIAQGHRLYRTLLCGRHEAQVRSGGTPWISEAVALDPASGPAVRQSARVQDAATTRVR